MTVGDKIIPNMVSGDIGCAMECIRLGNVHIDGKKLDKIIRDKIPAGFEIRRSPHRFSAKFDIFTLIAS